MIILIVASVAYSQQKDKAKNLTYAEIFGNGLFFSVNYERIISENLSVRVGLGNVYGSSASNSGEHHSLESFPLAMINYLIEIYGNNYFEIGAGGLIAASGFSFFNTYETTFAIVPTIAAGYRYSPADRGFFFSITIDLFSADYTYPWGGIGVGFIF